VDSINDEEAMNHRLYFEDFEPGERVEMGAHLFTEQEILRFAREFDPQPFHIDPQAAQESIYQGIIASGWHTCSVIMRLMCDNYLLQSEGMGSPGVEEIRWLKPVRPGDIVRGVRTTLSARPSASKPDRGLVEMRWEGINQREELVVSMRCVGLFKRKS
jgi:acyl dehydratase